MEADCVTVVKYINRLGIEYPLLVIFCPKLTTQQSHGLFTTAELLVNCFSYLLFGIQKFHEILINILITFSVKKISHEEIL